MLCRNIFVEEQAGAFSEFCGRFAGEILARAILDEASVDFGMASQIVLKACRDVFALGNDLYGGPPSCFLVERGGKVVELLVDFIEQEREMGTSEDDSVDERVLG